MKNKTIRTFESVTEKQTTVISGFPGIGKSHLFKNDSGLKVSDSDSSNFSWESEGVRHPDWPGNYMDHIKSLIGKMDVILVSSHDVVRDAMQEAGIEYCLVFPDKSIKDEYIDRYVQRGNNEKFVELLGQNWEGWIDGLENDKAPNKHRLKEGDYLSDVIKDILDK